MELDLKMRRLEEFRQVYESVWKQEETLESIVPDYLPDISRVISASGLVYLKEKICHDGSAVCTGSIQLVVLYVPEGENGARALKISIPVRWGKEDPRLAEGMVLQGSAVLSSADTRLINPRKLLLRCDLMCTVSVFEKACREITCDVESADADGIEKRLESFEAKMITEVVDKSFHFSDLLRVSASRPPMEEILDGRVDYGTLEGKLIGKKLVCKGDVRLSVLYRSGAEIASAQFELPYTQVIDLTHSYEDGGVSLKPVLRQAATTLKDGGVEIDIEAELQATLWVNERIDYLDDCYSVSQTVEIRRSDLPFTDGSELMSSRDQVRCFCESGIPAGHVLRCVVTPFSKITERIERGVRCEAQFYMEVLYVSEDGAMCCVTCRAPAVMEAAIKNSATMSWDCTSFGDITAVPVTGGIEIRFAAEFRWMVTEESNLRSITEISLDRAAGDREDRASVIVRVAGKEDTLWSVARSCGAAVKDICAVNGLSGEELSEGSVIIVPVRRAN